MPIIKAANSTPLLKDAIVLDMGDLAKQARRLKEAAQAQAQAMIENARAQAQALVSQGHGEGFAKGQAEGFAKGLEEGRTAGRSEALAQAENDLKKLQETVGAALAQLDAKQQRLTLDAQQAVLELALKLGEKLVHRIVEVDPQVASDVLADALAHVLGPMEVMVRICPEDRTVLEEALPELNAQFASFKQVHLVDDATIGRGGCVLTYGQGRLDATVETKLRRVVELILPKAGGV